MKRPYITFLVLFGYTVMLPLFGATVIPEERLLDLEYTEILDQYQLTDVESLIGITTPDDVKKLRMQVRHVVFGKPILPLLSPQNVKENIVDPDYSDMQLLDHIDLLTLGMAYGINSRMYYFHSANSNGRLVIYHQGHGGDFLLGKTTISGFLRCGYDVIALAMPLKGKNNKPVTFIKGVGTIYIKDHEWMRFLEFPLSFFMSPIQAAIKHGLGRKRYRDISLVGLSGGGWAVTLYAALDERVNNTYQVAGTMPFFLRSPVPEKSKGNMGDFEQHYVALIKAANYLELYVIGSVGKNRKQIQIINQYDSVAAHGIKYRTYASVVSEKIDKIGLGGSFRVVLDPDNPDHSISPRALEFILDDLDSTTKSNKCKVADKTVTLMR